MLTAKKTWYNPSGDRQVSNIQVPDADQAFKMAEHVWRNKPEAYAVTLDVFGNGAFVTRVMSRERMIFKIECHG